MSSFQTVVISPENLTAKKIFLMNQIAIDKRKQMKRVEIQITQLKRGQHEFKLLKLITYLNP